MQKGPIEEGFISDQEYDDAVFKSQEHFENEISRLFYGDLYVIGKLWIQTMRKVLVGADVTLIPIVLAAKAEEKPPPRPPKMKYKDLPIYESPHYEYKDYLEDQKKCPKANVKILQTYLYPKVKNYRQSWVDSIREFNKDAKELKDIGCQFVCQKKDECICYLRSPDNLTVRQAILATGMVTGYFVGRSGAVLRRLFGTTLGGLTTGALVFPKETDVVVRDASFRVAKFGVDMFNNICGMNFILRESIPCRDDMPPPPPVRPADQKNKCLPAPAPPKKEPAKKDAKKKEPGKADAAKKEPAKAEAAKKEPGKPKATKKEPASCAKEPVKTDCPRKEPGKPGAAKEEPIKQKPPKD